MKGIMDTGIRVLLLQTWGDEYYYYYLTDNAVICEEPFKFIKDE